MAQIDASANGVQRDRGTMFEEVVKSYLLNEPAYKNLYTDAGCKVTMHADKPSYRVQKMRFKSRKDHSVIKFNSDITISDIPARAYDYVVNGRSAIEWIMDQYRVKTDKVSQITDDPNDYSDDPQYILNLLLSVITVSMKTLELIDKLPKFEIIERDDR